MDIARLALQCGVVIAVLFQLWRVPRLWAFLFLFIVIFPKVPLFAVPGETTPIRVDDVVMAAVLGGWVLTQLLGRPRSIPSAPATPFILLYGLVAIVTSLLGVANGTTTLPSFALHFLRRVEYALLYYLFFRSIGLNELHDVVRLFRFALLTIASIWLVQQWTAAPTGHSYIDMSTVSPSFSASYDFGGYLMLSTVFLYSVWSTRANRGPWTLAALLAGLGLLLFSADSRASLAGMAVAIMFDLFFRLRWQVVVGAAVVAVSAQYLVNTQKMERMLATVTGIVTSFSIDSVQDALLEDPSIGMRLRNWDVAIQRWSEHPLMGEGLGSYLQYTEQYNQPGTPDGWYVRLLAESGLLGLFAFMLLVGGLLWSLMGTYVRETHALPRAIVYGAALGVIAMLVNAVLIDSFVSYKIMGVFWMLMGVGTRLATQWAPTTDAATAQSRDPLFGGGSALVPNLDPSAPGSVS